MGPTGIAGPDSKRDAGGGRVHGNGIVCFEIKPLGHVPTSYSQLCQQNVWISGSLGKPRGSWADSLLVIEVVFVQPDQFVPSSWHLALNSA
jgi:hypothetical protein